MPDLPEDSPFREFFRRFFGEGEIEEFEAQSLGSGFIISQDGFIISNGHVVRDADEVIVRMSDRREYKARSWAPTSAATWPCSRSTPAAAGGAPRDRLRAEGRRVGARDRLPLRVRPLRHRRHRVRQGRSLPRESYVPFIQTDVAINPGNSGGPLFNLQGEVIGVNSQIFSRTGGFMGLSFAIPIDVAMDVVDQLRDKGRVSRGWLGVLIQDVTRELAESFGMARPRGALIARVLPGGPAERAGIEVGDVVLSFDDQAIERSSDLPPVVGRTRVGREAPVEVLRNGESMILTVTTEELPEEEEIEVAAAPGPEGTEAEELGLTVRDPSDEERASLDAADQGVLVSKVSEGPGRRAGIREGDLILMLNNEKVSGSEDSSGSRAGCRRGRRSRFSSSARAVPSSSR